MAEARVIYSSYLRISSIPVGMTERMLRDALVRDFVVFENADRNGTLLVRVFEPRRTPRGCINVSAVISGFQVNLNDLMKQAEGKKLYEYRYLFQHDNGDERKPDGTFKYPKGVKEKRLHHKIFNVPIRTVKFLLNEDMSLLLNETFLRTRKAAVRSVQVTPESLSAKYADVKSIWTALEYHSTMDCLQSIIYWNGQPNPLNPAENIIFFNQHKYIDCKLKLNLGLGENAKWLDLNAVQMAYGYIPIKKLSPDVIDIETMERMHSECFKCRAPFKLLGFDRDLKYAVGKCSCLYHPCMDVMSESRAYFVNNENFTRLLDAPYNQNPEGRWIILFDPMRSEYNENPKLYRDIVAPIFFDEWKTKCAQLAKNKVTAELVDVTEVEVLMMEHTPSSKRLALTLRIPLSDFWNQSAMLRVGGMALEFQVEIPITADDSKKEVIKRNAPLYWMKDDRKNQQTFVFTNVKIDSTMNLNEKTSFTVTPYPYKTEYTATINFLDKWKAKKRDSPWLRMILDPKDEDCLGEIQIDKMDHETRIQYTKMFARLNNQQRQAVQNALYYNTSVVEGPPGTGKTFIAAAIIMAVLFYEKKHVIAVAPSNFACDRLTEALNSIIEKFYSKNSRYNQDVLRVYSVERETMLMCAGGEKDFGPYVKVLHQEVKKAIMEGTDIFLKKTLTDILNGGLHTMKQDHYVKFYSRIRKIERKIFSEHRIIVCTPDCISDQRINEFNSCKTKIGTVLIDEAANLSQPSCLQLLALNQQRTVLVGDHHQLRPVVFSRSAEDANLIISQMEWMQLNGKQCKWTTLKVQYRMPPKISRLVSQLTYNGLLEDADCVSKTVPKHIADMFHPPAAHPLLVIRHHFKANYNDGVYSNPNETEIVKSVCERIFEGGTEPSRITVLTLYNGQRKALQRDLSALDIEVVTVDFIPGKRK